MIVFSTIFNDKTQKTREKWRSALRCKFIRKIKDARIRKCYDKEILIQAIPRSHSFNNSYPRKIGILMFCRFLISQLY